VYFLMSSMGNGLQGPQQLQLMPGQGFQRPPTNQVMPYTIANAGQQQPEPGEAQIQELANSTAEIKRGIVEQKNEQSSLLSNRLGCLEERNLNAASSKKAKKERQGDKLNLLSDSFVSKDNKPRSNRSRSESEPRLNESIVSVPGSELDGGNGLADDSLAACRVLKGDARSIPRSKEFRPKIRLSR
jgi:hypothetical protein